MARIAILAVRTIKTQGGTEVRADIVGDTLTHPFTFPTIRRAQAFADRVQSAGRIDTALWLSQAEEADRQLQLAAR